jgi:hypothetical protein
MAQRGASHEFIEIARIAQRLGFVVEQRASGHMAFVAPSGAAVPCNHKPTGTHTRRNVIAQLRRAQRSPNAGGGTRISEKM